MKRARPLLARSCALLGLVASLSCVPVPSLPPPPIEPAATQTAAQREASSEAAQALLARLRLAHKQPATVSGDAKAFVDAAENGGRYSLLFALARPDSLRIDALMPWGEPAASLVTRAGRLLFRDDRRKQFFRGASTPRNLSLLLPSPLTDSELIDLLRGAMPELPGADPAAVEDAGDGKQRLVLRVLPAGMQRVRGYVQTALVAPDLTVLEVSRFIEGGGKSELIWSATLSESGGAGAAGLPGLIHFHVAGASVGQPRDVEIDLRLKNVSANHPSPNSAFTLLPPAGMPITELDATH